MLLDDHIKRVEKLEQDIEELVADLEALTAEPQPQPVQGADDQDLAKLRTENEKLKYRLNILKRAYENETRKAQE